MILSKRWKRAALQCLGIALLPGQGIAQAAVPLDRSLLQWTWWVTDFAGKTDGGEAPTFLLGDDNKIVTGTTACGTEWWATVKLDFPKISISDVQATAYDCPHAKEVTKFLTILEAANRFHTGPDGLEILARNGRRVLLMVSGA